MPTISELFFVWSTRISVVFAALCALLALYTGLTGKRFYGAASQTLLLAGVGAMLYGIWVVLVVIALQK